MIFPLSVEYAQQAERDLERITDRLLETSEAAGQRFTLALEATLQELCRSIPEKIAQGYPPQTNEDASLGLSRPTYRTRFETVAKRARRSSVGVWYVFYWLIDGDGDRVPETLRVLAIRHGSAPPLWNEPED
ncbi:type II toxin-antitoxin system RelE/ParE family toxin [Armatimonas sp.]|uniref:type II toxin-antitoxin system RelE/ParE family toxin n=1 Tax=Armatimonas sp. TaxID=1872638 RepID=UPI00286A9FD2|nr:type II toxin-antitoxin system RelE/ParE family toxin [Armatimonas sp.]